MTFNQTSFWRDSAKLYLQYLSIGVAAIPAGVLYAFLSEHGHESTWTLVSSIAIGCLCARKAWILVGRRFAAPERPLTAANATIIFWRTMQAGVAPSADLSALMIRAQLLELDMRLVNAVGANSVQAPATESTQSTNNGLARTYACVNG